MVNKTQIYFKHNPALWEYAMLYIIDQEINVYYNNLPKTVYSFSKNFNTEV